MNKRFAVAGALLALSISGAAQALTIDTNIGANASEAATNLTNAYLAPSSGINVLSSSYVGQLTSPQSATYSGFNLTSSQGGPNLQIGNGIFLTSGRADIAQTNNDASFDGNLGTAGDAQATAELIAKGAPASDTRDANSLTIEFTVDPGVNQISSSFLFGSDEFPDQGVTDFFMFFIDDVNYAFFNDGSLVSFVNGVNSANFVNNQVGSGNYGIEYDGLSLSLGITGNLDLNRSVHTLKVVIGDTSDSIYDSGVFLSGLKAGTGTNVGVCGGPNQPACDVPEPGSMLLVGLGLVGLLARRRAKQA